MSTDYCFILKLVGDGRHTIQPCVDLWFSVPVSSCPEGPVHHAVVEVVRFVEDRIKGEDGKDSRSLRGPYLARLELIHRLRERGCPEESMLGNSTPNVSVFASRSLLLM